MPPFSRHAGRRNWEGIEEFYNPDGFFDRVVIACLDETDRDVPRELGSLRIAPLFDLVGASRAILLGRRAFARIDPVTRALVRLANEHEVDLLVQRYGGPFYHGIPIACAAAALGLPSIIALNADYDATVAFSGGAAAQAWARLLNARRWQILLSQVDTVWSVSDQIRYQVLDRGFPVERVVTIPNKESIDRFAREPSLDETRSTLDGLGLSFMLDSSPVFLSVGRLIVEKNYPVTLDGFARVVKRHAARWVIVGRGPEEARIRAEIAGHGLEERVHLVTDYLSAAELRVLYRAAVAVIFCSLLEGQGRVPFESMACGTPVVGANVGPIPEMVRDGETGVLADPRDPASIAGALERVLNGEMTKDKAREACIEMAAGFDLSRVEPREIALYQWVLERSRRK